VKKEVHILMLEDNATDAELTAHTLREGAFHPPTGESSLNRSGRRPQ
jgi:hypothetical protein